MRLKPESLTGKLSVNESTDDIKLWELEIRQRTETGLLASFFIMLISFTTGILIGVYFSMPDKFILLLPVYAFPSLLNLIILLFKSGIKYNRFIYNLLSPMSLFTCAALGTALSDERFLTYAIMVNIPLFVAFGITGLRNPKESRFLFLFAMIINVVLFYFFSAFKINYIIGLWLVILPIALVSLFMAISRYKLTRKNFMTDRQLVRSNEMIQQAHERLNRKHIELEAKNNELTSSIHYARYLQQAILPPLKEIKKILPGSFIIYKPKDVVSGDFYWMEVIGKEIFIAAADCTGHGVPGAMVSVVCYNSLNRAVKEFGITEPGLILNKVRELVLDAYSKSENEIKDGMDISLASIDLTGRRVKWAGANNPLWYFHDGEMKQIRADKQPIGKTDNPVPFTTHDIQLNEGDSIFLFTDGFADQFGGPAGKKFMKKQLHEVLTRNISLSPEMQQQKLTEAFDHWKGELEQVDDVCLIGLRI